MPLGHAAGDRSAGPAQNGTPKQPQIKNVGKLQETKPKGKTGIGTGKATEGNSGPRPAG